MPHQPVHDSSVDWWCAMERAAFYAGVYEVRYHVFHVGLPVGGWWMITPASTPAATRGGSWSA